MRAIQLGIMEAELVVDAADLAVAEHRAQSRLWVLDAVLARLGDRIAEGRLTNARHRARASVGDDELRASIVTYYQSAGDIGANEDRDPYCEQLEDAFASIDVAFGDSLSLDELAARGRQVPSFLVTVRRAQNRMRTPQVRKSELQVA